jgi:hypothetical protein
MITDIGARYGPATTLTVAGASPLVDVAQARGEALRLNLTAPVTGLRLVNGVAGLRLVVILVQTAASSTVTWHSTVKFTGGAAPTLTTTLAHADVLQFYCYDGTNYFELSRSLDIGVAVVAPSAE